MRLKLVRFLFGLGMVCGVSFFVSAQETRHLTVEELFDLGIRNSLKIKASGIQTEIASSQERTVRLSQLPEIGVGFTGGYIGQPVIFHRRLSTSSYPDVPDWSQNYDVELSQPLYQGGKIHYNIKKAELESKITSFMTEQDMADLKLWLMGRYLDLLRFYKQKEVLIQNIEESKRRVHDIRQMRKEGMVTQNDVIRSELEQTNFELSLRQAEDNLTITSLQLDVVLGLDENLLLKPDTTLLTESHVCESYSDYVALAYSNNPELKISGADIQLARIDERISKSDYFPALSLRAGNVLARPITSVSPVQDLFKNSWNVSVVLSYRLSSLYRNGSLVKTMRRYTDLRRNQQKLLMQDINVTVRSAYIKHQEATDRIDVLVAYLKQANENYRIVRNKYLNQLAILTDLLDAGNLRLQAELQLTDARANEIYTYYQLLRSSGKL